jgi:hypothetical protein
MSHPIRRWLSSWPVFVLLLVAIFIWRRPEQFLHPYVWVEEGTITLPAYLADGWKSVFAPVAGYMVLPAKLIFLIAASLSFAHLPSIEYWLTMIFEVGTLALVAFSPTRLRFPKAAALAIILLPTDSEVFAVSEYAFWWGTIWAFVAIFWDEGDKPRTLWRCMLVAVGGLSSPMALPVVAILGFRAAALRKRADFIVLAVALSVATVQWVTMRMTGALKPPAGLIVEASAVVTRFFGHFFLASSSVPAPAALIVGSVIVLGGAVFVVVRRKWQDTYFLMLAACLVAAILASATRVPVEVIHPFNAGPRYFFFPYIFLAWLLLYTLPEIGRLPRLLVYVIFAGALSQFMFHGQRIHDRVSWRQELNKCVAAGEATYPMPIHYDGDPSRMWHVDLTGNQCSDLKSRSIF